MYVLDFAIFYLIRYSKPRYIYSSDPKGYDPKYSWYDKGTFML